jgi:hypothetical protein
MRNTRVSRGCGRVGRNVLAGLVAANALVVAPTLRADVPATRPAGVPVAAPSGDGSLSASTRPASGAVVDLRRTVTFLASDALEGRGSGTPGIDMAGGYVAGVFMQLGLKPPPGWDSYFQPFPLTTSTTVDPKTSLAAGGAKGEAADGGHAKDAPDNAPAAKAPPVKDWSATTGPLKLTDHYQPLSFSAEGKFDAPVVFVGYGVSSKHRGYDDFDGVDVKGKVVLAMRFEPMKGDDTSAFTGKKDDWSENAAIPAKAKAAAERGAVALVLVNPPNHTKPEDAIAPFAKQSQFERAGIPVIQVKRPIAEAWLAAAGAPKLADLQTKIDDATKPASAELPGVLLKGEVAFQRSEKTIRNVAAVLPGKGPNAGEYVVVGAHYDHLGRGGLGSLAPFSKEIHHGADDNASGTTVMLKLAEEMAAAGPQDRSILFVAFTGEELGLLGSARFVNNPPVPTDKMAAMLNLDMVGRVRDDNLQVGGSGTAPGFENLLKASAEGTGLKLGLGSKGGLGPSDHTSFAVKKVPVLFFFSGLHADYHRPTDTADKINYDGMEKVATLGRKVLLGLAAMPREAYVSTFDSQGMMGMSLGSGSASGGTRVSLGIVPDYSDDAVKGVRLTGTSPGSAAERAGLKGGDVIVGWGDKPMDNLTDMMGFLMKGKPGDKVKLKVVRDGKPVELEATLTERKG